MDFAVPAVHCVKIKKKKRKKRDKYLDFAREIRKLLNMWVKVISLINGAMEHSPRAWKGNWKSWKSKDESRLSTLQYC